MGQQLIPASPLYNMAFLFDIRGAFDPRAFQTAFAKLLEDCAIMRTVFRVEDNEPVQVVLEEFQYELEILDWRNTPISAQESQDWARQRSERPLDLENCCFDSALIQLHSDRHLWYLNQHHLITDAWSVTVVYKAVMDYYQLALNKETAAAPKLAPFADYVDFEAQQRQKAETAKHWNSKMLPVALPRLYGFRGVDTTSASVRVPVDLGIERASQLRALADVKELRSWTVHATLFNVFITTLFAYVFRVSGQRELAVGSPAHNRSKPAFRETPGVFIELFPLVVSIEDGETFMSLYQKVRAEVNSFLMNGQPGSSTAAMNRAFGIMLNYIHVSFPVIEELDVKSHWLYPGHSDPRHHLRMLVYDFDQTGGMQVFFDLNADVFDAVLRQRAPGHYLNVLDAFLQNREQLLTAPTLLNASEEEQSLKKADLRAKESTNDLLVTQFEQQVALTPQRIAIRCAGQELTYEVLNQKANQLASYLLKSGLSKGDHVAIYLKRSPELLIAIWGVLKSGLVYVPISWDTPSDRVQELFEMANCQLLLSIKADTKGQFPISSVIALDSDQHIWKHHVSDNPSIPVSADDLAYVMFTSGSTGQPKGVMISHGALANYVNFAREQYTTEACSTFALFTRIGFDLTVTSIFTPFVCGGSAVVYPEHDSGPDLAILDVLADNAVDIIKLTPSHLELLRTGDWSDSRIRVMIVGGEDFKASLAAAIKAAFPNDLQIYNEYGPTEATVGCVVHLYQEGDLTKGSVPIGQPTKGMEAYVLDEQGHLLPAGVIGELFVAGQGLAQGYWQDEERTLERFVPHAFQAGELMYRTGDLARVNTSGELEFSGRSDEQMKIGGIRVEPGEIEAQLSRHDGIESVVVTLRQGAAVPELVAFYTANTAYEASTLRAYLMTRLPLYLIPNQFQFLEEFPLSPNGKIDRRALQSLELAGRSTSSYVAPSTQVEELIAGMWEEVLGVEQVGIHDDFLSLGGTSLSAIRLMSRINETLDMELSLGMIFQAPTVALFATRLEEILEQLLSDMED